jgi:hypothetical protein
VLALPRLRIGRSKRRGSERLVKRGLAASFPDKSQVDKAITSRNKTSVPRELADPKAWSDPYDYGRDDEDDFEAAVHDAIGKRAAVAVHVISCIMDEFPDSPKKWGIAFAVAAKCCVGRTMAEVAATLGVTRAIISYHAQDFCRRLGLPPSSYMKDNR